MRKAMIVLLIAVLSLSMLAFFAGCGTNQNKEDAKNFMISGDDYMNVVDSEWIKINDMQNDAVAKMMQEDYASFIGAAGETAKQAFETSFDTIDKSEKAAAEEYKSITALDDVQDYKDYANKMLEATAFREQQLQAAEKLLNDLVTLLGEKGAGQQVDVLSVMMNSPEIQMVTDYKQQADALIKEAEQIKQDKKLES